jgi:hypothetical protein
LPEERDTRAVRDASTTKRTRHSGHTMIELGESELLLFAHHGRSGWPTRCVPMNESRQRCVLCELCAQEARDCAAEKSRQELQLHRELLATLHVVKCAGRGSEQVG